MIYYIYQLETIFDTAKSNPTIEIVFWIEGRGNRNIDDYKRAKMAILAISED